MEVQANDLLTRRARIICAQHVITGLLYRLLTFDDIERPDNLTIEQQIELLKILVEYRTCFAKTISALRCTDCGTMNITLKAGSVPFAAKPYREERDEIRRHIQTKKDHRRVEDSSSAYTSPVLLVSSKKGESRLVVDYRRLNDQTDDRLIVDR